MRWAVLGHGALDFRDDRRFRHTRRLVWGFVQREFEPVPGAGMPDGYPLHRRRNRLPPRAEGA